MSLRVDTVTIVTPGTVSDRGTDVDDWDNTTDTVEDGWRIQPQGGNEETEGGRQGLTERFRGFGPSDSVVTAKCHIVSGANTYEVDGPVESWPSPTGNLAHVEVPLRRVTG